MSISQQVKHRITLWLSNAIPGYKPERVENKCSNNNTYINVHRSSIRDNQKVETTQTSVNE